MRCQATVVRENGGQKIHINGVSYVPLSFKSFRPNPRNVSEFYEAGVRLFSVLTSGITSALGVPYSLYGESWVGPDTYDFSAIDRQMDMFIANAPSGYFAPMLQVDTRDWYLKSHPGVPNSFTHLSQVACDGEWKQQAAAYIKAAIRHIEEKYGDRVYGYFLLGGTTTEWFSHCDEEAPHPIKEAGYRQWCGDGTAVLPSKERLAQTGPVFLSPEEGDVYRARRFHNELIADLILYFAAEAQAAKPAGSVAQVAVFAEGEAMYRARKTARLASVSLSDIRRTLASCGAPYDLYSIGDIALPVMEQYQVFLFVNQYALSPTTRAAIEAVCNCRGKTVIWLYAPDYARESTCRVENIAAVTGMWVTVSHTPHGALVHGNEALDTGLAAPYFAIDDPQATPLARFADGAVAAASVQMGAHRSVYVADGNLPVGLLRDILKDSGVHLYSREPLVYTYASKGFVGVYNATDTAAHVYLPTDGVYLDRIRGGEYRCEGSVLTLPKGELDVFYLERKKEAQ